MTLKLPKSHWKIGATPSRPATTAATDIFSNLKTQCQGLTYWVLVETPNTGTTSLLLTQKSTTHVTGAATCQIVIANAVTGTTAYRQPDTNTSNATQLQVGLVANINEAGSGSFQSANRDRPFQTVTGNPRWSGYWHWATTTAVSATFIVESEDVLGVFAKDNSSTSGAFGFFAGAIIETLDSGSGENDRRVYGMVTTGPTTAGFSTTFWASTTTFLGHNQAAANAHAGAFVISGGQPTVDTTTNPNGQGGGDTWIFISRNELASPGNGDYDTFRGTGSRQVGWPVMVQGSSVNNNGITTAPIWDVGVYRGIYRAADSFGGLVKIQSGGIDQCYKVVATHTQTYVDAVLLGPASGSVIIP